VVRPDLAVLGVDLASAKQAAVVCDHDSVVLGRRMFNGSPWLIDEILDWALPIAVEAGFAGVVVGCEPTGHRWKPLLERCGDRGVDLVCVNPMLVHRGREEEDFTRDRSDFKDSTIIARRVADRRCYIPYALDGEWCRLRHLGARRSDVVVAATAARQQARDLLECTWPAALAAATHPFGSRTWRACMAVSCQPERIVAMGYEAFAAAVGVEALRLGGHRRSHDVMRAFWAAATAPDGVDRERAAALERVEFALADWERAQAQLAEVEARMVGVLDDLDLTDLVTSIDGLSAVGAAAILAETGDPARFDTPRTWVKHAGLCPRDNESGTYTGATRISGRGRPGLRTAAWRAIWGGLHHNAVYTARYQHLRTRASNPLNDGQARSAIAAALLRQLYVIVSRRVAWDPAIAAGHKEATPIAA